MLKPPASKLPLMRKMTLILSVYPVPTPWPALRKMMRTPGMKRNQEMEKAPEVKGNPAMEKAPTAKKR